MPEERNLSMEAQRLKEEVEALRHRLHQFTEETEAYINTPTVSESDRVDLGFCLREMSSLLKAAGSNCKRAQDHNDKVLGMKIVMAAVADPNKDHRVRGTLATGGLDLKIICPPPAPGTPEFLEACEYFGVPADLAGSKEGDGLIRFSWTQSTDLTAKLQAQGIEAPPGFGEPFKKISISYRRRGSGDATNK